VPVMGNGWYEGLYAGLFLLIVATALLVQKEQARLATSWDTPAVHKNSSSSINPTNVPR